MRRFLIEIGKAVPSHDCPSIEAVPIVETLQTIVADVPVPAEGGTRRDAARERKLEYMREYMRKRNLQARELRAKGLNGERSLDGAVDKEG